MSTLGALFNASVANRAPMKAGATFMEGVDNRGGVIVPGNIDLKARPIVERGNGMYSTVASSSFNIDGKEVLLPTVHPGGYMMSPEQTVQRYKQTGEHLGIFNSTKAADRYAQKLHESQAKEYESRRGKRE